MGKITVLDGKKLAEQLLENESIKLSQKVKNRQPKLVVITIGNDDASKVYIRNKEKACNKCNIIFEHKAFASEINIEEVTNYIQKINQDKNVDGIMVQQPVPNRFKNIEQLIVNEKDVDGFTTYNLGGTLNQANHIPACTPSGIIKLLDYYNVNLEGKHVIILGRSNIVGKPLIGMLLNKNATVTSCNSYTKDLKEITKTADIIISSIGKPKFIDNSYITSKCECIIDVGINRDENGKLCGDIDYNNIIDFWSTLDDKERFITPVPGGIGPMTVYSLIKNVIDSYNNNIN